MKNKHPYYDSDKKKATESFAVFMIGWGSLLMILLCIILAGISSNESPSNHEQPQMSNPIPDPPHKIEFVSDSIYQLNMQFINSYDTMQ
jgi:hypothetical protein